MHEWLEALRKSAKAASEGVRAEEVRRAETECGVPFPPDLANLYQTLNGGEFQGEVRLYPLRGDEGAPSVLEKSRLSLVGLPAAGVWRFGLKGPHRHLFVARKSAMEEQGDGGGPLPGWVEALDSDDWVFGTWENEKKEMRLYRTLKDMIEVLVPPVEVESFGERTFARAMNAVLQGALSGAEADTGEEDEDSRRTAFEGEGEAPPTDARDRDYSRDLAALAQDADEDSEREEDEEAESDEGAQEELFEEPETKKVRAPAEKKGRAALAVVPPSDEAPSAPVRGSARKSAAAPESEPKPEPVRKTATKSAPEPVRRAATKPEPAPEPARKAAGKKTSAAAAPTRGGARKAAAKKAAPMRGAAKKAAAKKAAAPSRGTAKKAAAKGAAAKKGAVAKKGAASKRGAAKKAAAPKRGASAAKKGAAKKAAAPKRGASAANKRAAAKKGAARTASRKPAAKKSARRS
ncbi:hypothetical protein D7V97_26300 [Corallococcus sp. CA053C]|uniref:SMI1/KNR4 family protein n=1 Tax=Corallococcus sp. CA053C TaxID=2316732 RepID=UPI000EA1AF4A|nr:SMI1/KNR4 family protein [Corallococcus sp. CA053C]RKH03687.1 hypothetical protein D7V97_26300 [Corallococcus sp. CA053C]